MIHERLRQAREQKGWSLDELSRRAGLRTRTIELIDRGQFAELPAGLYCRSSIRSYAVAVGLDAEEIIEALRPLLPTAGDPLDGLARRCGHARKAEPRVQEVAAAMSGVPLPFAEPSATYTPDLEVGLTKNTDTPDLKVGPTEMLDLEVGAGETVCAPVVATPEPASWDDTLARAEGDDDDILEETVVTGLEPLPEAGRQWWRPVVASAFDGLVLAIIGATLVWLTARVGATTVPIILRSGAPGIALVFALIVALYFVLFGGVGNATPGGWLMRLETRPSRRTLLNPREVFGRACRSIYRDNSLVAD